MIRCTSSWSIWPSALAAEIIARTSSPCTCGVTIDSKSSWKTDAGVVRLRSSHRVRPAGSCSERAFNAMAPRTAIALPPSARCAAPPRPPSRAPAIAPRLTRDEACDAVH